MFVGSWWQPREWLITSTCPSLTSKDCGAQTPISAQCRINKEGGKKQIKDIETLIGMEWLLGKEAQYGQRLKTLCKCSHSCMVMFLAHTSGRAWKCDLQAWLTCLCEWRVAKEAWLPHKWGYYLFYPSPKGKFVWYYIELPFWKRKRFKKEKDESLERSFSHKESLLFCQRIGVWNQTPSDGLTQIHLQLRGL